MPQWHSDPLATVLENLGSSVDGLAGEDARTRLESHGRNELSVGKDTPEIVKFLLQFSHTLAGALQDGRLGVEFLPADHVEPGQG